MKKVEQVLPDGGVVEDFDQPLRPKQVSELFFDLFGHDAVSDRKQHIVFGKIGLLVAAVTYLGHPWPIYKKRIQLKDYYPEYYAENTINGIDTLYLGVYHYQQNLLFVVFEPETYVNKKSHNSSAHVQTFDLQYAARTGFYSKVDSYGNSVRIMDVDHFVRFIRDRATKGSGPYDYDTVVNAIKEYMRGFFHSLPKGPWVGIDCYKEMKAADAANYRQGEWQGWYFEYLFKKYWKENPNDKIRYYGRKEDDGIDFDLVFDAEEWIFGDLKSDKEDGDILGNDFRSFDFVIEQNGGRVFYIVLRYSAEQDKNHGYKTTIFWNDTIREESRRYSSLAEIKSGYGKRMKYSVTPRSLKIISIDSPAYRILKENPFYQGRNSNGQPREPKLRIGKDMIEALTVYSEVFES